MGILRGYQLKIQRLKREEKIYMKQYKMLNKQNQQNVEKTEIVNRIRLEL